MPAEQDHQELPENFDFAENLTKALEAYLEWEQADFYAAAVIALAAFEREVYGDAS